MSHYIRMLSGSRLILGTSLKRMIMEKLTRLGITLLRLGLLTRVWALNVFLPVSFGCATGALRSNTVALRPFVIQHGRQPQA